MKTVSVIPNKIKDKEFRVLRNVVRILEKQVKVIVDIGSCGRIDGLSGAARRYINERIVLLGWAGTVRCFLLRLKPAYMINLCLV